MIFNGSNATLMNLRQIYPIGLAPDVATGQMGNKIFAFHLEFAKLDQTLKEIQSLQFFCHNKKQPKMILL